VAETTQLLEPSIPNLDGLVAGLALVTLIIMTPWLLRLIWSTEPLPGGEQRRRIEQIFRQQELRIGEILVWRTDQRIVNAVLAGLTPICRYLFISDGMLDRLPGEKLTAIVAHEAGHLRHRHLLRLFLSLQIPFSLLMVTQLILNRAGISIEYVRICSTFGIVLGWLAIHTRISQLLEHQADVAACYILAGKQQLDTDAVDSYSEALTCATSGCSASDWLHPSPLNRIAMLQYLLRDVRRESHFHAQIRRVTSLLLSATIAIAACWLVLLISSAT
jgi:Zn-dependent protease with chaperone function